MKYIQTLSDNFPSLSDITPFGIFTSGLNIFNALFGGQQRSDSEELQIRSNLAYQLINTYGLSGNPYLVPEILQSMIQSRSPNFTVDMAEYLDQTRRFINHEYPLLRSINDNRQSYHDYTSQIEAHARLVDNQQGGGGVDGNGNYIPGTNTNTAGIFDNPLALIVIAGIAFSFMSKSKKR
jgi:hypothetical protein